MELTNSILKDTRESLGLSVDDNSFDKEIISHINSAIGKLNQNGVGKFISIKDELTTWEEFRDPNQTVGNDYFHMIPLYVTLSTKLLFDPPPPSSVEYHASNAAELLWRLKIAYEGTEGDI
jgi:hypothetical protein